MSDITPNELARMARLLDANTFRVWAFIRSKRGEDGLYSEPRATLAADTASSIATVNRAIRAMKQAGILTIIRETPKTTVYRLADSEPAEEGEPQPSHAKISHLQGPRIHDMSNMSEHSNMSVGSTATAQKRANAHRERSFLSEPSEFRAPSEEKTKTEEKTTTALKPCISEKGGGGGKVDELEGFALLAGMKSLSRRRALATKHTAEVIRTALDMAKSVHNVNDVVALASSFLDDGSATEEAATRAKRKQKAQAHTQASQDKAAAARTLQEKAIDDDAKATAFIRSLTDEELFRHVHAGIQQVTALEKQKVLHFAKTFDSNVPLRKIAEYQAMHWTLREFTTTAAHEKHKET